jgi:hypothetical protein
MRPSFDNVGASLILFLNGWPPQARAKVVWPFRAKWTVDTLPQGRKLFFACRPRLPAVITLRRKA